MSYRIKNYISSGHPLCTLGEVFNWGYFESLIGREYTVGVGKDPVATRMMVGLHYLKFTHNLSDEEVLHRWLENPYWQRFCGREYFSSKLPLMPRTMKTWRKSIENTEAAQALTRSVSYSLRKNLNKKLKIKKQWDWKSSAADGAKSENKRVLRRVTTPPSPPVVNAKVDEEPDYQVEHQVDTQRVAERVAENAPTVSPPPPEAPQINTKIGFFTKLKSDAVMLPKHPQATTQADDQPEVVEVVTKPDRPYSKRLYDTAKATRIDFREKSVDTTTNTEPLKEQPVATTMPDPIVPTPVAKTANIEASPAVAVEQDIQPPLPRQIAGWAKAAKWDEKPKEHSPKQPSIEPVKKKRRHFSFRPERLKKIAAILSAVLFIGLAGYYLVNNHKAIVTQTKAAEKSVSTGISKKMASTRAFIKSNGFTKWRDNRNERLATGLVEKINLAIENNYIKEASTLSNKLVNKYYYTIACKRFLINHYRDNPNLKKQRIHWGKSICDSGKGVDKDTVELTASLLLNDNPEEATVNFANINNERFLRNDITYNSVAMLIYDRQGRSDIADYYMETAKNLADTPEKKLLFAKFESHSQSEIIKMDSWATLWKLAKLRNDVAEQAIRTISNSINDMDRPEIESLTDVIISHPGGEKLFKIALVHILAKLSPDSIGNSINLLMSHHYGPDAQEQLDNLMYWVADNNMQSKLLANINEKLAKKSSTISMLKIYSLFSSQDWAELEHFLSSQEDSLPVSEELQMAYRGVAAYHLSHLSQSRSFFNMGLGISLRNKNYRTAAEITTMAGKCGYDDISKYGKQQLTSRYDSPFFIATK